MCIANYPWLLGRSPVTSNQHKRIEKGSEKSVAQIAQANFNAKIKMFAKTIFGKIFILLHFGHAIYEARSAALMFGNIRKLWEFSTKLILFAIGNVLREFNRRHRFDSANRYITAGHYYKTHWRIECQLTAAAASLRRLVQNEISGRGVNSKKEIPHRHNIWLVSWKCGVSHAVTISILDIIGINGEFW